MTHAIAIQVYMLDKRMLDPRRPKGPPTAEDQLEQLIPYQQNLIMSPLLYASHSKQVAQLSGNAEPQCMQIRGTKDALLLCC